MIGSPLRAPTHRRICSPGKTTFPKFMLVWLLSARQVVLLCDSSVVFLFYRCQVYSRSLKSGFDDLPTRLGTSYCPVWALIDTDDNDRGPPFTSHSNIWPIQTSSPNSVRWKSWSKQNRAATLGMPNGADGRVRCWLVLPFCHRCRPRHSIGGSSLTVLHFSAVHVSSPRTTYFGANWNNPSHSWRSRRSLPPMTR